MGNSITAIRTLVSFILQVHELELKLEEQTAAAQRSLDETHAASADQIHRLEQTRQDLTDQLWRKSAELDAAQSKLEAAQRTLEERRADIANYKEQLVAGAAREKELQRQVVQATLRGEQVRACYMQPLLTCGVKN